MRTEEPVWTAELMNAKEGDSTFKTCGHCEHRGGGSYKYDTMISGSCSLMKDYGEDRDVKWDTPCKIMALGKGDIASIIQSKKYEIKNSQQSIKSTQEEIEVLRKLKIKERPPLPENRTHDYYNLKDVVYVLWKGKWNRGVVVSGYRHHDGCVSYVLDGIPESNGPKGPWGCGMAVPGILKEWEYKYFKKNKEDFKTWLKSVDRKYNGERINVQEYSDAMEPPKRSEA